MGDSVNVDAPKSEVPKENIQQSKPNRWAFLKSSEKPKDIKFGRRGFFRAGIGTTVATGLQRFAHYLST